MGSEMCIRDSSNTLRHRLRRFEEATGATLRDPRDLVELWWALERRRLAS